MSLASILNIARSALLTQQKALDVTGHNIANASVDGYSRQRLRIEAATPLLTPMGSFGRGVEGVAVERARSQFLDATFRQETGLLGKYSTTSDILGQIEDLMGEPSDSGLGATIDNFLSAMNDLANDPANPTTRLLARQAGQSLVGRFNEADARLGDLDGQVLQRLQDSVDQVNSIAKQIAGLNPQIQMARANGQQAPDLEDQRDRLLDQLSGQVGLRVIEHGDGTIGIMAGDAMLVDGGQAQALDVKALAGGGYGVGYVGNATVINTGTGGIQALADLSTTTLPNLRTQLDTLANGIVTEVNGLHRTGTNLAGATNVDFFNPAGTTAKSMALSAAVLATPDNIAASATGGAGDGSIAMKIAALRTAGVASLAGKTIGDTYTALISSVASQVQAADQGASAQQTILASVTERRSSERGVSVDEELTNLIQQQHAFAAASRLVSVADEMMQSILQMVG